MVARESAQPNAIVSAGNLERDIIKRRADGLDLFGERAHIARATTRVQVKAAHVARHRCQSALIVQSLGESLASRRYSSILPHSTSGSRAFRRSKRRSIACSRVSRETGRWVKAVSASSKHRTASRWTERAKALAPAC